MKNPEGDNSHPRRLQKVLILLIILVIAVLAYFVIRLNHNSHAGNTYTQLGNIDLNGQTFYEEACITSSNGNLDTLAADITVNRQDGPKTNPLYNTTALSEIDGTGLLTYDNWNTGSTSTITFDVTAAANATFNLGVENGANSAVFGPSYRVSSIGGCNTVVKEASASCTPNSILVNPCRPLLGAATNNYNPNNNNDPDTAPLCDFECNVDYHEQRSLPAGDELDLVHTYNPASEDTLSKEEVHFATRSPSSYLFLDWNPTNNWASISNDNAEIDAMADSIKNNLGTHKMFLTVFHEPENNVTAGGSPNCNSNPSPGFKYAAGANSGTTADFVSMWQYVYDRFATDGVTNVVWATDLMNYPPYDCMVQELYPGDHYVDWIMFNAYDMGDDSSKTAFADKVSNLYNLYTKDSGSPTSGYDYLSHPWGIVEWGITGETTAFEEDYYEQAAAAVTNNNFPNLHAYMIYDSLNTGDWKSNENFRVGYDDAGSPNGAWDPTKQAAYNVFADAVLNYSSTTSGFSLSSVAPSSGPTTGGTTITLTGKEFASGDTVKVGTNAATSVTVKSSTTITAVTPAGSAGIDSVTVSGGGESSTLAGAFTYTATVPTTPTGLTSPSQTSTSISLTWNASTETGGKVTGYNVKLNGVKIGSTPTTSYTDTGLYPSTPYTYTVVAFDANGNYSSPSTANSVTTLANNITAPSNLASPSQTTTSISLTWNASSDPLFPSSKLTYQIYRAGAPTTPIGTTAPGVTSYTDSSGLSAGTYYDYTITASDPDGTISPPSKALSVETQKPPCTPPPAPANFMATATSSTSVSSWDAVPPPSNPDCKVINYVLERGGVTLSQQSGLTYTDNTVLPSTKYSYTVLADVTGNIAGAAASATVTTPPPPKVDPGPSAPTNLVGTAISGTQINLTWTASTDPGFGIKDYEVLRNGVQINTTTNTSYGDSGLSPDSQYKYQVIAVSTGDKTAASDIVPVNTLDTIPPTTPTGVNSPSQTTSSITLSWQASTDPGYPASELTYSISQAGSGVIGNVTGSTSFTVPNLSAGITYSYTITASDPAGNSSAPTAPFQQETKQPSCSVPAAPGSFSPVATSATSVSLSWDAVTPSPPPPACSVAYYLVSRGSSASNLAPLTKVLTGTTYTDPTVIADTTYYYGVEAVLVGSINGGTAVTNPPVTTPKAIDTTPPTAPSGLSGTAFNSTQINLTWNASSDPESNISGYNVYRDGTEIAKLVSTTGYGDSGLQPSTTYSYYVVAVNGVGLTTSSSTVKVTTAASGSATIPGGTVGSNTKKGSGGSNILQLNPELAGTTSVGSGSESTGKTIPTNPMAPGSSTINTLGSTTTTTKHKASDRLAAYIGGSLVGVVVLVGGGMWLLSLKRRHDLVTPERDPDIYNPLVVRPDPNKDPTLTQQSPGSVHPEPNNNNKENDIR